MSKIGQLINNRIFNPIITNISYDTLYNNYFKDNKSINIVNAFIISVPQDENGNDLEGKASIWMTDANGYLLNLTKPIQQ